MATLSCKVIVRTQRLEASIQDSFLRPESSLPDRCEAFLAFPRDLHLVKGVPTVTETCAFEYPTILLHRWAVYVLL